ncbi:putative baseplate assembly protein [Paenibacillus kobensis]|uniref:putative baseplate assembly protein n=1 Tax=Paenibacillus kobensis TaxID=59841 RepID=UPI000FDB1159|nr:putative baseplate assembly protein [Paenibacillus kobensis]
MRAPLIDGRDVGRIIGQLLELAPYYVPEWNALNERDPAAAVIRIFAGQYVDTLERLNRVPDKNLLTFLSKLGVSLLPATQARAPVTFRLSAGVKEAVLIPAQTQVAAQALDGGKPVVFETRKPMLATPARMTDLLSASAGADAIYAAPPGMAEQPVAPLWAVAIAPARQGDASLMIDSAKGLLPGDLLLVGGAEYAEVQRAKDHTVTLASPLQADYAAGTEVSRVTQFKLFEGLNKQEHFIYLAHDDLLRCGSGSEIRIMHGTESSDPISIRWQYWDGSWTDMQQLQSTGSLRAKPGTKVLGLTEVNGRFGRWLRGRVAPSPQAALGLAATQRAAAAGRGADNGPPVTDGYLNETWRIAVQGDESRPDLMFSNNNPVEPGGSFYLFGASPRTGDTLYISSADAFSKKGGSVTLTFILGEDEPSKNEREQAASADPVKDIVTSEVSWEYWNGGGWLRWERTDMAYDEGSKLSLTFRNGDDVASTAVQGQENFWIRCRLFALPPKDELEIAGKRLLIRDAAIHYKAVAPAEQALEYRSLRYRDSAEGSWLESADALDEEQAMYVGFDRAPLRGPISLYLSLVDQVYDPDQHPIVEWQYYAEKRGGSGWVKLDAVDGTNHLTRSGCLEFVGLPDWTETEIFGRSRFWLRAVDTLGVFKTADSKGGERAPAPIVQGIYRNTTVVDQAESFKDEVIGSSRGTPDAVFTVSKSPVVAEELYVDELSSISDRERQAMLEAGTIIVEEKDDKGTVTRLWVRWTAAETLTEAGPDNRCYAIDRTTGRIWFGDGIHGKVPPIGTNNVKLSYRSGGGARGNVEIGAIAMLKSSIAYVDGVANPEAAAGGYDTEDSAAAKERGPLMIRHRFRAVTAADYESLVFEAARGIARVKCLPNVNEQGQPQTGRISLLVVPQSAERLPQPSAALRQTITDYIQKHAANVVASQSHIHIRGPAYAEVSVHTVLVTASIEDVPDAEREALSRLKSFLHPLSGGPAGTGWEFGRVPALSDLYVLLGSVTGLEYVDRLEMIIRDADGREVIVNPAQQPTSAFPQHLLIYSGMHQVVVRSLQR